MMSSLATWGASALVRATASGYLVAKKLINIFSRVGFPEGILSDQGTNFMSALLAEVYHLLQINKLPTFSYHPQTDGLVEHFNATEADAHKVSQVEPQRLG